MPLSSESGSSKSTGPSKPRSLKLRESYLALSETLRKVAERAEPPPVRNAAQWADQNRILPIGSAEPGPYRSSRTPYCLPIAEWFEDPRYDRIVVIMATQMGKTSSIMNIAGKVLDDDPAPILYIAPTKSMIDGMIEPQVMDLIRQSPSLQSKLYQSRRSRRYVKRINGVTLRLAWAGSATELASQPAKLVIADEVDKFEAIPGHGDVVTQLDQRKSTHADGKSLLTSSPTEGNVTTSPHPVTGIEHFDVADPKDLKSRIWQEWQSGTKHELAVPCPHCQAYFVPRFALLRWPEGCTPTRALREAFVACPANGCVIRDESREWILANGRPLSPGQWIEGGLVCGDPIDSRTASLWVSGLLSPWISFGARAAKWIAAVASGDPEQIRAVLNLEFGELYRVSGEAPDWQRVADCRLDYGFEQVPDAAQILECGVDVQKDRLFYSIRGWGTRYESWGLRHGELFGDTEHDFVWTELGRLLMTPIAGHRMQMMLIDSGYRPGDKWRRPDNQIYKFCRQFLNLAFPTKGHEAQEKPIRVSKIDVTLGGQVIKEGLQLLHLDSDFFKSWVHTRLTWPDEQPGGWHISREATDDYCQQVVAEARVVKASGRATWVRTRRNNHYLDAEALNVAAAYFMNVHLLQDRVPTTAAVQTPARGTRSGGVSL